MTEKLPTIVLIAAAILNFECLSAQKTFEEKDLSFKSGEKLTYAMSYKWGPIFTDVGEVRLNVEKIKDDPTEYRVKGEGFTYKFYDKLFKVRDYYEARFTLPDFLSSYFHRNINEGDYSMKNTYNFDWNARKINAVVQRQKDPPKNVDLSLENNTLDVLTYFYFLRNTNFDNVAPGNIFTVSIALDDGVYNIKCRFLGREAKKIKAFDMKVNCLKFAVEVIAGSVFKGNEKISLWVSDDKNRIPLELESPIIVGKIKGRILKCENLKYPLNLSD